MFTAKRGLRWIRLLVPNYEDKRRCGHTWASCILANERMLLYVRRECKLLGSDMMSLGPAPSLTPRWYAAALDVSERVSDAKRRYFWRKLDEAQEIARSGLFDENWYREKCPVPDSGLLAAVVHYIEHGARAGREPHPAFDSRWYSTSVGASLGGLSPLGHFVLIGRHRALSPHPLFDVGWYIAECARAAAPMRRPNKAAAFRHFLVKGAAAGISPHPLFDAKFYLERYADLASANINPLTHYVACGAYEGRDPNSQFKSSWYLLANPAVRKAGMNPLVHFMLVGAKGGLQPDPDVRLTGAPEERLRAYLERLHDRHRLADYSCPLQQSDLGSVIAARATPQSRPADRVRARDLELDLAGFRIDAADRLPRFDDHDTLACEMNLDGIGLVTVDVWDTIIRRDCHPDEVKLQSARALALLARSSIKSRFADVRDIYRERLRAETATAKNAEFEYRFTDAIDGWLHEVLEDSASRELRAKLKEDLLRHEAIAEKRATRPDNPMVRALRAVRQPKVFASDFYMPKSFLASLLDGHGIGDLFVGGYSSSDTFDTKRSGNLFDRILRDHAVPPEGVRHIGDNRVADVDAPAGKGISAVHYVVPQETARRDWFEQASLAWARGDGSVHQRRILAIVEDIAAGAGADTAGQLQALGARLAPLAVGYCLSILEDALSRSVDRVHFFTREGIFFRQVFDKLAAADPYNLGAPRSDLLGVSRRSTFAASMSSCSISELMRMWTLYSTQSLKALAVSLNLDERMVAELANLHGLEFDRPISAPWEDRGVRDFLASKPFQSLAGDSLAQQKALLKGYLAGHGFGEAPTQIVADIGWRGTIQDNLARVCPNVSITGHYLGLFRFLNPQPGNAEKKGWVFDDNARRSLPICDVAPIEMVFNGPGGSVVGYRANGSCIEPEKAIYEGEERVIAERVLPIQSGMLSAVEPIADYMRLHGLTSEALRGLSSALTVALVDAPSKELAESFFALEHNETFGTGAAAIMESPDLIATITSDATTGSVKHTLASRALGEVRWKNGAVRQTAISSWWAGASTAARSVVPLDVAIAHSPAIIRTRGTRLAVYVPPPLLGSGGHRTIFNVVRRLARLGMEPHILLEGIGDGVEVVEDYLGGQPAEIYPAWNQSFSADFALATIAHSANVVGAMSSIRHRAYLVQDFEALFNPMSDRFLACENSYAAGLQHFTIGNWISHVLRTQYGAPTVPAGLGIDVDVYRPIDEVTREAAVCFLYQPDKPRRAPLLGIEALRMVKASRPDVNIYVYGSNLPIHVDFDVTNLGLVTDLEMLNRLYNRCRVGLCISGSNPSRIPYEMMAGGCIPVDLYRYNNLLDHEAGTVSLAYQDSRSIAAAILDLLDNDEKARGMSETGTTYASHRTLDWEVDVIANSVLAMFDGSALTSSHGSLLYKTPPVIAEASRSPVVERFCQAQYELASRQP